MRIFVEERLGTQLTESEREYLEVELSRIESFLGNNDAILEEVESCKSCGLDSFDVELVRLCANADYHGIAKTLALGIVQGW